MSEEEELDDSRCELEEDEDEEASEESGERPSAGIDDEDDGDEEEEDDEEEEEELSSEQQQAYSTLTMPSPGGMSSLSGGSALQTGQEGEEDEEDEDDDNDVEDDVDDLSRASDEDEGTPNSKALSQSAIDDDDEEDDDDEDDDDDSSRPSSVLIPSPSAVQSDPETLRAKTVSCSTRAWKSKKLAGGKKALTAGQVGGKRPRSSLDASQQAALEVSVARAPTTSGLTIPFRTIKKVMKLDPDIPIVQNEAAILTTLAAELFLKTLARQSQANAKQRGRNTIRYEDVAEARTQQPSYAFLEPLLP